MWRKCKFEEIYSGYRMSQKNKFSKERSVNKVEDNQIYLNKNNEIMIQVHAKPGAKYNRITGVTEEGVGIQISAPPSDGEANTELVKYVSSVLGLRKNDVVLEKGHKSRSKTLRIIGNITIDEVQKKFTEEIGS